MQRSITLYYASISLRNIALVFIWWIFSFWRKPDRYRSSLIELLKRTYHDGAWFPFISGRAGIAAFLKAAKIGAGHEVIISSYTCLAVPTAVVAVGATPVYVDIKSGSLNIDQHLLWASVTKNTKALIVQHTLGDLAPINNIKREASSRGLLVIEDCALSIGSKLNGQYVGLVGDAAIFSMELSKTLSCGWGGLLLINKDSLITDMIKVYGQISEQGAIESTRDLLQTIISTCCSYPTVFEFPGKYVWWLCEKVRLFRKSTPKLEFEGIVADNFIQKMGQAQMLLCILQWRNFKAVINSCADNFIFFRNKLESIGCLVYGSVNQNNLVANRVPFLVKKPFEMIDFFRNEGVEIGRWFDGPLSPVPTVKLFNYPVGTFPVAEKVANHIVNIPCHNRLTEDDKNRIILILLKYVSLNPDAFSI